MNVNATSGVAFFQQQPLPDFVLIYGEEPLLNLETLSAIRERAQAQGYEERVRLDVQHANDWSRLGNEVDTPSLFAPKRLIELHCDDKKLSKAATDTLLTITSKPNTHTKLVLYAPNLSKIDKQAWYKTLFAKDNVVVRSFTLYPAALQKQIEQRLQNADLTLTSKAKERLLSYCQGNLLAAKQAIERLRIHPEHDSLIDEQVLEALLSDLSQFKVFALTDAILQANWLEAYKIAGKLAQESQREETLITWLIQRDMSVLLQLITQPNAKHPDIFKIYRIAGFQQKRFQVALRQFSAAMVRTTLTLASKLDGITKGAEQGDYWQTLRQYLLLRAK